MDVSTVRPQIHQYPMVFFALGELLRFQVAGSGFIGVVLGITGPVSVEQQIEATGLV